MIATACRVKSARCYLCEVEKLYKNSKFYRYRGKNFLFLHSFYGYRRKSNTQIENKND